MQKARKLLEADFAEQLEGMYDVLLTGAVPQCAGSHHPGSVFPASAQRIEA
jgi:hypothetical protein